MSKDPGKVWCIWRVYLWVINAEKISGLYQFVTELRLKKWKNSNLKWWNFENLKFWFFSPHFLCVWAGPKLLTHNIGPYVGSLSSKKKFLFFLIFFEKIENFDNLPILRDRKYEDFLMSQDQNRAVFWKADKICFPARYGLICFWARLDPKNWLQSFFLVFFQIFSLKKTSEPILRV